MESETSGRSIDELGRILLADDEETFLQSTADLLRREGYRCDCVHDGIEAAQMLGGNEYDLLIADTELSGNSELELVRNLPTIAEGLPVILVTDHPSLRSAIQSVKLRVEAYLVKPLDFEELLGNVRIAVKHCRVYRSVRSLKQRLQHWYDGLQDVEELLKNNSQNALPVSVNTFFELTFQNVVGALADLKHLTGALAMHEREKGVCHLFNCPRLNSLSDGVAETIDILQKTKSAFKSRDLGEIRGKLNELINSKA